MAKWEERPTNSGILPFILEARDEDYDTYLFWPSLSNGMESSEMSFAAAHHKVTVCNCVPYKSHRYTL